MFKFGNGEEQEASDEEARLINCILDKSYGTNEDVICEAQLGKRISINEYEQYLIPEEEYYDDFEFC